ncbi:MAG: hypothetical protein KC766_03115, partial [Myxococcales bacterium]|nr:hypothetical protein [Myxococcales bacterium]
RDGLSLMGVSLNGGTPYKVTTDSFHSATYYQSWVYYTSNADGGSIRSVSSTGGMPATWANLDVTDLFWLHVFDDVAYVRNQGNGDLFSIAMGASSAQPFLIGHKTQYPYAKESDLVWNERDLTTTHVGSLWALTLPSGAPTKVADDVGWVFATAVDDKAFYVVTERAPNTYSILKIARPQ